MDGTLVLQEETQSSPCVVRLKTSAWRTTRGIFQQKSLIYMKRRGTGWDWLDEDVDNVGAQDVLARIVNLHTYKDGYYRLVTCREHRDYETGMIDDYDYQLIKEA